ncbi:hypothetical protein SAMN05443550_1092 [Pedobacter hartonius]|uniref:Uncharacterized protein n=1 Tax=Pedobacter hartonius TaxID=425514 RepID=A0A1H4G3H8_9SPHI|nr:hypothetical protein SAMN05443550_1092 [Pedobacter hartonius]
MKNLKRNDSDNMIWQQVSVKIKNADADRRNENQSLMNKVQFIIENQYSKKTPPK